MTMLAEVISTVCRQRSWSVENQVAILDDAPSQRWIGGGSRYFRRVAGVDLHLAYPVAEWADPWRRHGECRRPRSMASNPHLVCAIYSPASVSIRSTGSMRLDEWLPWARAKEEMID
jgi:hypothetical protein